MNIKDSYLFSWAVSRPQRQARESYFSVFIPYHRSPLKQLHKRKNSICKRKKLLYRGFCCNKMNEAEKTTLQWHCAFILGYILFFFLRAPVCGASPIGQGWSPVERESFVGSECFLYLDSKRVDFSILSGSGWWTVLPEKWIERILRWGCVRNMRCLGDLKTV